MAALDAVLVAKRPELQKLLADLHLAANDPIERTAIEQFIAALMPRYIPASTA